MSRNTPKIGQYIKLKKSLEAVTPELKYNFKGCPEIPVGSWIKITGYATGELSYCLEFKDDTGTYQTTRRLYTEDYELLPVTDDSEMARILYDKVWSSNK